MRAANVNWSGLALADVKEMAFTEAESQIYELQPGDLLLGEASGSPAEVGKPGQYKGEIAGCCFQNTLLRVRVPKELDSDFYELFFRKEALTGRFAAGSRGVGIHHLGAAALTNWTVPVPPRAEQERIVTAIDEAFSKLDAGEAALRAARQRLKRLRESVLSAAVTGRLVPQDLTDEPSSKLLANARIPEALNHALVGAPPSGWSWVELGNLAHVGSGTTPNRGRADYWSAGTIPWVTSGLVNHGVIHAAREFVTPSALDETSLNLWPPGTLLVAMYGEGKTRGRCAELRVHATCNQACAAIVLRQEVERQFTFIDACERIVEVGLARSAALLRSILKSAFDGKLVPQDPTDEPGAALLRRIAESQGEGGPVCSSRKRQVEPR